nr:hypothetical protein [Candidatus Njordarchaeum guaymaensis]
MRNAKYKFMGLLLIFTLFGFVVLAPVNAVAPSWVSTDKYAKYRGGVDINLGTNASASVLVDFNWKMVTTLVTGVNVTGGWILHAQVNLMGLNMTLSFSSNGWEIIDLFDSTLVPPPGGDIFFGMEHMGAHTNLWVDNMTGLTLSNVSIGGRRCYQVPGSASIGGLPIPGGIPVTKYFDTQTGVLMGLGISLNLTALMGSPTPPAHEPVQSLSKWSRGGDVGVNQFPGMEGFELLTFPVVMNSTNVVPFAWNVGGDPVLLLEAFGVLLGLSALFGVIIYTRKK